MPNYGFDSVLFLKSKTFFSPALGEPDGDTLLEPGFDYVLSFISIVDFIYF